MNSGISDKLSHRMLCKCLAGQGDHTQTYTRQTDRQTHGREPTNSITGTKRAESLSPASVELEWSIRRVGRPRQHH